jgi:chitinase
LESDLVKVYEDVITHYGAVGLDFDIEGAAVTDHDSQVRN